MYPTNPKSGVVRTSYSVINKHYKPQGHSRQRLVKVKAFEDQGQPVIDYPNPPPAPLYLALKGQRYTGRKVLSTVNT